MPLFRQDSRLSDRHSTRSGGLKGIPKWQPMAVSLRSRLRHLAQPSSTSHTEFSLPFAASAHLFREDTVKEDIGFEVELEESTYIFVLELKCQS